MKEQNCYRGTLWMTEGSAALVIGEDMPDRLNRTEEAEEDLKEDMEEDREGQEEQEEQEECCGLSCAGKLMCGMAALLEEYLLFLVTGIRPELTPPVTILFIWVILVVISAEAVRPPEEE